MKTFCWRLVSYSGLCWCIFSFDVGNCHGRHAVKPVLASRPPIIVRLTPVTKIVIEKTNRSSSHGLREKRRRIENALFDRSRDKNPRVRDRPFSDSNGRARTVNKTVESLPNNSIIRGRTVSRVRATVPRGRRGSSADFNAKVYRGSGYLAPPPPTTIESPARASAGRSSVGGSGGRRCAVWAVPGAGVARAGENGRRTAGT